MERGLGGSKAVRLLASAAIALAAPVALTGEGLAFNDAEACTLTGTCCKENTSICNAGGPEHMDYYYKSEGKCSPFDE